MMAMNTSKTLERTSTVLGAKCEETEKNMAALMAEAGCAAYDCVRTSIPMIPGSRDDVVFVGLNGVRFYFMRGKTVDMPEPLLEILRNAGVV